eukprot:tig00020849_g14633.t1
MPEDTAEVHDIYVQEAASLVRDREREGKKGPSPHDIYVQRYLKTGQGRIIGNIRTEYALRKDGFVFPIELCAHRPRPISPAPAPPCPAFR